MIKKIILGGTFLVLSTGCSINEVPYVNDISSYSSKVYNDNFKSSNNNVKPNSNNVYDSPKIISDKDREEITPIKNEKILNNNNPEREPEYKKQIKEIALSTRRDPDYKRITLSSPENKKWFHRLTYRYWKGHLSRYEFVNLGLLKYPNNQYEFEFIANGIDSRK